MSASMISTESDPAMRITHYKETQIPAPNRSPGSCIPRYNAAFLMLSPAPQYLASLGSDGLPAPNYDKDLQQTFQDIVLLRAE
jgi:hypothetical protein